MSEGYCRYCGRFGEATWDHVVPRSRGGVMGGNTVPVASSRATSLAAPFSFGSRTTAFHGTPEHLDEI